jgi:glycerol-3-phosphate acyltransferase PlsY
MLKGLIPMLLGGWLMHRHEHLVITEQLYLLWMGVGCAAILGHLFSVFLKFKGGKGVATSAGVMLGLWPYYTLPGLVATLLFIIIFKWTRYVSLASVLGIGLFPLFYIAIGEAMGWPVTGNQLPLLIFAVAIALLIIWKHRTNLARLRAGTEHRFAKRSSAQSH